MAGNRPKGGAPNGRNNAVVRQNKPVAVAAQPAKPITRPAPTKPTGAKTHPAKAHPLKPTSTKPTAAKPHPVKAHPAKPKPVRAAPAKPAPTRKAPAKLGLAKPKATAQKPKGKTQIFQQTVTVTKTITTKVMTKTE